MPVTSTVSPARTWARWVDGPALLRIDHCFGSGVRVDDFRVVAINAGGPSASSNVVTAVLR